MAQENNKFGMSLLQPSSEDIRETAQVVNGNSGDWGYVTLVVQENDRDVRKWQDVFEQLRENHLIPLIRLATSPQGEVWRSAEKKDAKEWALFLNKLNWVIKKRYIILFNEPNHASEWGGEVNPEGYGKVALAFAKTLKSFNNDYIIMLAGMDAAAPSYPPQYEDSGVYIKKMFQSSNLELKEYIDAWSSHSYPNPGFSGSVWDGGKKSIQGYNYELNLIKELGIDKNLPVFITETGWKEGALNELTISENYYTAYKQIWGPDSRVQAVTPFVFKYLSEPFLGFSWKKDGRNSAQLDVVKDLPKEKGNPEQIQNGSLTASLPSSLVARSTYHFSVLLKNTGQAIWNGDEGYALTIYSSNNEVKTLVADVPQIKPFDEGRISFTIKTPPRPGSINISIQLKRKADGILTTKTQKITIEPFPELTIHTSLFPKFVSNGDNFEVQLFNKQEELVFSKKGLSMKKGIIAVQNISDVIPGQQYRVVLLGYPYIPRQDIKVLSKGANTITLKRLLPFDADGNGSWDMNDIKTAFLNPEFFLRFIPWRD